jgi:hypothetical protein
MTPSDINGTTVEPADEPRGDEQLLDAATESLRAYVDPRWVEVSDRILARVLTASRRSLPIRTSEHSSSGALLVSEQVLTTYIRHAVAAIPAAAPTRIHIHSDSDHNYTGVTIEITVQFNEPILPIADDVRARTEQVLRELLGDVTPPVTVNAMHVHVCDVTTDDPRTGRPRAGATRAGGTGPRQSD